MAGVQDTPVDLPLPDRQVVRQQAAGAGAQQSGHGQRAGQGVLDAALQRCWDARLLDRRCLWPWHRTGEHLLSLQQHMLPCTWHSLQAILLRTGDKFLTLPQGMPACMPQHQHSSYCCLQAQRYDSIGIMTREACPTGEEGSDGGQCRDQCQAKEQRAEAAASQSSGDWVSQRGQVSTHQQALEQAGLRKRPQAWSHKEPKVAAPWRRIGPLRCSRSESFPQNSRS